MTKLFEVKDCMVIIMHIVIDDTNKNIIPDLLHGLLAKTSSYQI